MKILAGIPTRCRNTSGKIADILAEVCDEVLVVSQGADVICDSRKVTIVEKPKDGYGLVRARNYILEYAVENGYDIVIQSDDDLSFKSAIIEAMVKEVLDNPTLGAIASSSRAYFNWNKTVECTKNFLIAPCAAQLWASRTSILTEVGKWHLEFLEDREHGARMWKNGYAIGLLHISLDLTHNPFIARTSKSENSGGQEQGLVRYNRLKEAISIMDELHRDIVTIKQSEYGFEGRTFSTRYNWSNLLSYPILRFGYALGYEDSNGKRL